MTSSTPSDSAATAILGTLTVAGCNNYKLANMKKRKLRTCKIEGKSIPNSLSKLPQT